jgi:uncharacterized coiled-coil protein SlyX
MEKLPVCIIMVMLLFCFTGWAVADEPQPSADAIAEMKEQIMQQQKMIEQQNKMLTQMMARIEQLESQQKQSDAKMEEKISTAVDQKKMGTLPDSFKWVQNVKISGDLRYRHESIDAEGSNHRWVNGRTRHRIRARLMLKAMINGDWDLVFRLASGTSDPVSTNQTLDEGFSSKDIRIDLAYFDWHPAAIKGLNVFGGKMKFPLYKVGGNQLIWDSDLTPEGLAANYMIPLGSSGNNSLHVNGGAFWAEESASGADQSLWAAQGYLKHTFDKDSYLLGGASYYCYGNVQRNTTIYDSQDGFGNTTYEIDADDPNTPCCDETELGYVSDYDLLELFTEYGTKINGTPVSVFGNFVKNMAATTNKDTGWLIGGKLNKAKEPGSWELSYDYRELEADAVLGVFSDSDFIGGGTDGKGHRFGFGYQFTKNIQGALTYFLDERDDDNDYRRLQADLIIKF